MLKITSTHFSFIRFTKVLAQTVVVISVLVFIVWCLQILTGKNILPDYAVMNPTSGLLFGVCGIILWLYQSVKTLYAKRINSAASIFVLAIASIRLSGYIPSLNIGIDRIIFRQYLNGSEMAPNTAVNFLFTGFALWLLNFNKKYSFLFSQLFALATLSIAILAMIGYLYADLTLYRVAAYIPMAFHTAITFFYYRSEFYSQVTGMV